MVSHPSIRAERSAMQDHIRSERAKDPYRQPGRAARGGLPNAVAERDTLTTRAAILKEKKADRAQLKAKVDKLHARYRISLAVRDFTRQHGRDSPDVKGGEFKGNFEMDGLAGTHPVDLVAQSLAPAILNDEVQNWVLLMDAVCAACPVVGAEDWQHETATGISTLKTTLMKLLEKLH